MKKLRNIKPGQRKRDRREKTAALESQAAAFLDHTKECCLCKKEFIRTQETVTTWQVMVREDTVRLTCPPCWELVQTEVEKRT